MALEAWNKMFMIKLTRDLWVRQIHAYYLKNDGMMSKSTKQADSGIRYPAKMGLYWCDIESV